MERETSPVYRKVGKKRPFAEQLLIRDDRVVTRYAWEWFSPRKQGPSKAKRWSHPTVAKARARLESEVALLVDDGWTPVLDWPGASYTIPIVQKPEKAKPRKKPKPPKRITLAQLKIGGRAARATPAELAAVERRYALPADWKQLVQAHGPRMFANLLAIKRPAKVIADTKRWVKFWTIDNAPVWTNFAKVVPDATKLVLVAASTNGDIVGYTGKHYVIFPRGDDLAVRVPDLASVFGWFLEAIAEAGDRPSPTYAPER